MKTKGKPASKIPTTKENTNKKRQTEPKEGEPIDTSLLKKNEFTVILIGAGLVTVLIFLVFFFSSGPKKESKPAVASTAASSFNDLEKRLSLIEASIKNADLGDEKTLLEVAQSDNNTEIEPFKQRVERLETAFSVKFDSISDRLSRIEQRVSELTRKSWSSAAKKTPVKKTTTKTPVKKVVKKTEKKEQDLSMFHTVQKKETLYSISRKYKTTVAKLRQLNKLDEKSKIFPGDTLLIK